MGLWIVSCQIFVILCIASERVQAVFVKMEAHSSQVIVTRLFESQKSNKTGQIMIVILNN